MVQREVIKKICLLGDGAVGKTSLIRKYVYDMFDDKYITTIGTKVTKKSIILRWKGEEIKMTLMVWDILGQKEHLSLHRVYYQGAEGALIVADATRVETIDSLPMWTDSFISVVGNKPFIFLLNKIDLISPNTYDYSKIENVSKRYNTHYMVTSAKVGLNVDKAFTGIGVKLTQTIK
ncbi:MAG: Rab family GTPase [Candidatus Thermoplasmatota archaeon]